MWVVMKSSLLELRALCVAPCLLVLAVGCGGPPKVRSAGGERLPADGAPAAKPISDLPSKTIAANDWSKAVGEQIAPACDAREGVRTADARNLEGAGKVLGSWTELRAAKGKSNTAAGKKVGGRPEPTRLVSSVGMTCAAGASMIQVNGVRYPFDLAWVVTGEGKGRTLNGDMGAGNFVMIQALSFKDQRVVFAKVFVPSDAHDDTDDTVIISSLAGYLPERAEVPVVRVVSDRDYPKLETFIASKGVAGPAGISFQVPEQDALGRARYLGVARFDVAR
jgi:hypothetical protein